MPQHAWDGQSAEEERLLPSPTSSDTLNDAEDGVRSPDDSKQSIRLGRGLWLMFAIFILVFLQATNVSIITTTQSAIAGDLDAFEKATWFTSAYLIAMSSTTPLAGRLSQIFSPRVCIFVSAMIFAIGTLVTSVAQDFLGFIAGRAITGVGAAGNLPIAIVLVLELTGGKRRGLFIGILNTGFTIGVALGAVLAGALAGPLGWRATFWLQAPFAVVAGISIFFLIPKSFTHGTKYMGDDSLSHKLGRVDYLGVITLTSSLVLLLSSVAAPKITITPIVLAIFLLLLFILIETRYAAEPIIPVSVLKSRGTLLSCLATLGFMMARWTILFYTPIYAIAVRGWDATSAGSMLVPTNGGFAVGGLLVGWLHIRKPGSYWFSSVLTIFLFSTALFVVSRLSVPDSPVALYMTIVFVNGFCTGAALNYTLAHLFYLTPPETHFIVSALIASFRGFGGSIASATAGGIFSRTLKASLQSGFKGRGLHGKGALIRELMGSPSLVNELSGVEKKIAVDSYVVALQAVFVTGAAFAMIMIVVQVGTGWTPPTEEKAEADGVEEEVSGRLRSE